MVHLDHRLIYRAQSLITGANVHRVKQMIFVYQQAVLLHNEGWPGHALYHAQYENDLRQFIERKTRASSLLRAA
jgi:hypothetical protein